ncbi:MAG: hypothetical protein Q8Q01_05250 [archaeon]|nr:hypothetical protein [archaeon]
MGEIKITLETLYDILRNEKKREDLQELETTFFIDVIAYLNEKKSLLTSKQGSDDLFAAGERDKLEYELRSIQKILKEIYEKREKKIIEIALNRSRTGSDIIDTSSMLLEEKTFYDRVLKILDLHRQGVLLQLFRGKFPDITEEEHRRVSPLSEIESVSSPLTSDGLARIRFLRAVPSFVWKDMKVYGPFEIGEITEIFPEVADLLVRKGRAQKL